jgi:hypothetical protein
MLKGGQKSGVVGEQDRSSASTECEDVVALSKTRIPNNSVQGNDPDLKLKHRNWCDFAQEVFDAKR